MAVYVDGFHFVIKLNSNCLCYASTDFVNNYPVIERYRWIKNGKHFDWQAYDDRISQQPGRGSLVISSPRDEDLGKEKYSKIFLN